MRALPARTILKSAILIAAALVGLWLVSDALTFALYAASAERAGGCYTTIELWLGSTHPDDGIRQAELFSGFGLLLAAVGWPVFDAFRWVRALRSPPRVVAFKNPVRS